MALNVHWHDHTPPTNAMRNFQESLTVAIATSTQNCLLIWSLWVLRNWLGGGGWWRLVANWDLQVGTKTTDATEGLISTTTCILLPVVWQEKLGNGCPQTTLEDTLMRDVGVSWIESTGNTVISTPSFNRIHEWPQITYIACNDHSACCQQAAPFFHR